MEIPLEDLRKVSPERSTIGKVADYFTRRGESKKPSDVVNTIQRSSSYSPRRGRTQSPGADSLDKTVRRGTSKDKERSRLEGRSGELRRPRAGSYPSPRRSSSGPSGGSSAIPSSKMTSTSFMVKPKKHALPDSEKASPTKEGKAHSRTRSNSSGACPKTLTPAAEPKLSLVANLESSETLPVVGLASAQLVPPAEPERIRSFSDTSSVDSEMSANQSSSSSSAVLAAAGDAAAAAQPRSSPSKSSCKGNTASDEQNQDDCSSENADNEVMAVTTVRANVTDDDKETVN